ncbi:uncharacterized protein KD926_011495 [Aspergillus affinis]|uniref:uncharacterized protein n=1 Tax=Aspergillus affinis TaxID=1070780 RepID=UPI0022FE876C|nr:uncharacterized protein KD926_011495 [Aspergillus affinis]KAI9037883.1 hypothetical protein KD926_011495 [Aspergillus affinis]
MYNTPTWEKFVYGLRHKTKRIPHLQVFIQRYIYDEKGIELLQKNGCFLLAIALKNCQYYHSYQEILAVLNAIILRIQKLGVQVTKHMHALAMYYAALAFSVPAMKPHVEVFADRTERLRARYSSTLVTTLTYALHALESPGLQHDIESMRCLIGLASNTEELEPQNLHSRLGWGQNHATSRQEVYLPFLAELRMDVLLDSVWETVKESGLSKKNLWPIYLCVVYMVKTGESSKACVYLKELSVLFDGTLPNISKMKHLPVLLEDPEIGESLMQLAGEQESLGILEAQLQIMEQRLGIRWEPEKSVHVGLSDTNCNATKQPLFNIYGEAPAGYDSYERLVAEIMTLGCSKSVEDLRKIADLLDNHDGKLVPISTPDPDSWFAWSPERLPMEFPGTPPTLQTDVSKPCPVSSLGLLRVRLLGNQISPAPQYPVRIIQLGRLFMRPLKSRRRNTWTPTDYIVGWDRVHARFLLVSARRGEDLEPDVPCGAIVPPTPCINTEYWQDWFISPLQQPLTKSHFHGSVEEDPGLDLIE